MYCVKAYRKEFIVKKGLIVLLCLVSNVCYAQSIGDMLKQLTGPTAWEDMTPEQQYNMCNNDYRQALRFINMSREFLKEQKFDEAWRASDLAFNTLLSTFSCNTYPIEDDNNPLYWKVRDALDYINELDDEIACAYHVKDGSDAFIRSELAFEQLGDIDHSISLLGRTIQSYTDAIRFCEPEMAERIEAMLPDIREAKATVEGFREKYGAEEVAEADGN